MGGAGTFRTHSKGLWQGLFELERSVWCAVLPYCLLNCTIMVAVEVLATYHVKIAFSPAGHGLMALIVSFLVISKVNLTYDRYMQCRHATGHALAALRELNQTALTFTARRRHCRAAMAWREKVTAKVIDLLDCTIRVIKNENQTVYLARNETVEKRTDEDPMVHVQALRLHLFNGNVVNDDDEYDGGGNNNNNNNNTGSSSKDVCSANVDFQLLERVTLLNMLNDYVHEYRNLLKLASTPIPFPLIQMARTFLFLWTFTIPLVLRGVVSGEALAALIFVFFLTYGFIGLELVSSKLMYPFGDAVNDLNVSGMREATLIGIDNDLKLLGAADDELISNRRVSYSLAKAKPPSVSSFKHYPTAAGASGGVATVKADGSGNVIADPSGSLDSIYEYQAMSSHNVGGGHFT